MKPVQGSSKNFQIIRTLISWYRTNLLYVARKFDLMADCIMFILTYRQKHIKLEGHFYLLSNEL